VTDKEKIAQLEARNDVLEARNRDLEHRLSQLEKMIFGSKRERFVGKDVPAEQLNLFGEEAIKSDIPAPKEQIQSYSRKKKAKKHNGRNPLPENLPVEEIIIEPDEDTTDMVRIGEVITETVKYTPDNMVLIRIIRPKYAKKDESQVVIAELPSRPIDKCIAEASLLAHIIVSKFIDHLPFYRQIQRFKRDYNWDLSSSTVNDWFVQVCTLMEPLYDLMRKQILKSGYIQADESPIKVLDSDKKNSTHQGFQWVYHGVEQRIIVFNYRKGRGQQGPKEFLEGYTGWLQCDGYKVYDKIGKQDNIQLAGCLAHARRKFYEAKDTDGQRASYALEKIKQIYALERKAKEKELSLEHKLKYRKEKQLPILEQIKKWIEDEAIKVLPRSPIGKAMTYYQNQWPKLEALSKDPRLELDNNLIENKIRPLALGRKNYLFAGNHKAAQRIAMMYSFFATCKANEVNPYDWMKETLEKLPDTKLSELEKLIPKKQGV
jgi:transposase